MSNILYDLEMYIQREQLFFQRTGSWSNTYGPLCLLIGKCSNDLRQYESTPDCRYPKALVITLSPEGDATLTCAHVGLSRFHLSATLEQLQDDVCSWQHETFI